MSAIDNKQLKAAQAEAATATDTYTHVFKKGIQRERHQRGRTEQKP